MGRGTGILLAIIVAGSALFFIAMRRKLRLAVAAPVLVAWLLIAELAGCFGGPNHAIPGSYTVTVSAMDQNVTRSVVLTLAIDCPK